MALSGCVSAQSGLCGEGGIALEGAVWGVRTDSAALAGIFAEVDYGFAHAECRGCVGLGGVSMLPFRSTLFLLIVLPCTLTRYERASTCSNTVPFFHTLSFFMYGLTRTTSATKGLSALVYLLNSLCWLSCLLADFFRILWWLWAEQLCSWVAGS